MDRQEEDLLAAVVAAPDDDAPRLAYADWCEARGDRDRAELIRLQCEAARLGPEGKLKKGELYRRWQPLAEKHLEAWTADLPKDLVKVTHFVRGFIEELEVLDEERFVRKAAEIFARAPTRKLTRVTHYRVAELAELSGFARIRSLSLRDTTPLGTQGLRTFLRCRHLEQLEELSLASGHIEDAGAAMLAESDRLPSLRELDLSGNRIGAAGARALMASTRLARLRRLFLSRNLLGPGPEGTRALADRTGLPGLRELFLAQNHLDPEAAALLVSTGRLASLQRLDLSWNPLGPEGAQRLAEGRFDHLRELDVDFAEIGSRGLAALGASRAFPDLRTLQAKGNRLNAKAMELFRDSALAAQLTSLDISQNPLGVPGALALSQSKALQRLEYLQMLDTGLTEDAFAVLGRRFGEVFTKNWFNSRDLKKSPAPKAAGEPRPTKARAPGASKPEHAYLIARVQPLFELGAEGCRLRASDRIGVDADRIPGTDEALFAAGARGWELGRPPGITPEQWPRAPLNGLPMAHLFTLELPEEYRTQGPELVALSFFQACAVESGASRVEGAARVLTGGALSARQAGVPFWETLALHARSRHARQWLLEDQHGVYHFAVIWLTEAELRAAPCDLPDPRTLSGVEPPAGGSVGDAYAQDRPAVPLALVPVLDPNAGKPPVEVDDYAWVQRLARRQYVAFSAIEDLTGDEDVKWPQGLRAAHFPDFTGESHIGGTSFACQGVPPGLSPFYIEVEDGFGEIGLAGGNGQLDLKKKRFHWQR